MKGKADLHIHSTSSDGNLSPAALVRLAGDNDLGCISLTDHDTVSGVGEAVEAGEETGVTVLTGVEITTIFNDREAHLLGYCFDLNNSNLLSLLSRHKKARIKRAEGIIETLREEGLELDIDEVRAEARGGNIGRPHIATVLIKKGYIANAREAFIRYLGDKALGNIKSEYCCFSEAVNTLKEAGGAAILAHPGVLYSESEIAEMIDIGIDGIEVVHPSHDHNQMKKYEKLANDRDLLVTGGSDYHGNGKNYLHNFGTVTISRENVQNLIRMTDQRKNITVN